MGDEIREKSFTSLRIRSEQESELNNISLIKEQFRSLDKEIQPKQLEYDDLEQKLHEIKKELSSKKRELENVTLQKLKEEQSLTEIQDGLKNIDSKKEELFALND